jgi:hypothetical protein
MGVGKEKSGYRCSRVERSAFEGKPNSVGSIDKEPEL